MLLLLLYGFLFVKWHGVVLKSKVVLEKELFKNFFKYGLAIAISSAATIILGDVDTVLLSFFKSVKDVALYNVARPSALLITNTVGPILTLIFPTTSHLWHARNVEGLKEFVRNLHTVLLVITGPLALGLIAFSRQVITVLFGPEYSTASTALTILAIARLLMVFQSIVLSMLPGIGKPMIVTKMIYLGAIINLIIDLVLIPLIGINGAAVGTLIATIVMYGYGITKLNKHIKLKLDFKDLAKISLANMMVYGVLILVKQFVKIQALMRIMLGITIAIPIYVSLLLCLRVITKQRIKYIINLLPHKANIIKGFVQKWL